MEIMKCETDHIFRPSYKMMTSWFYSWCLWWWVFFSIFLILGFVVWYLGSDGFQGWRWTRAEWPKMHIWQPRVWSHSDVLYIVWPPFILYIHQLNSCVINTGIEVYEMDYEYRILTLGPVKPLQICQNPKIQIVPQF